MDKLCVACVGNGSLSRCGSTPFQGRASRLTPFTLADMPPSGRLGRAIGHLRIEVNSIGRAKATIGRTNRGDLEERGSALRKAEDGDESPFRLSNEPVRFAMMALLIAYIGNPVAKCIPVRSQVPGARILCASGSAFSPPNIPM